MVCPIVTIRRPPRQPTRKGADRRMLNSMSDNEKPVAVVRRGRQKKSTRLLSTSESEEDSMMKHPRVTSALQGKNSAAKRSEYVCVCLCVWQRLRFMLCSAQ